MRYVLRLPSVSSDNCTIELFDHVFRGVHLGNGVTLPGEVSIEFDPGFQLVSLGSALGVILGGMASA
jgi:hypothetical protein